MTKEQSVAAVSSRFSIILEYEMSEHSNTIPVVVAIPVKNEATHLERCLSSLSRFSEVVVIDSGSSDGTVEIAERFGAKVARFEWNGRYPKKRNWFLMNYRTTQPWVLFLDADEQVSELFCDSVAAAIAQPDIAGYWITYINHFQGEPLRFGLKQRKLALFRFGSGLYERIEENNWSTLDMEVHEHPIVDGKIGNIPVPVVHHDYSGLAKFIKKHTDYAVWEAHRFHQLTNGHRTAGFRHTFRQRVKYYCLDKWWYPFVYFVFNYIVKLGFLDGSAGFHYSYYKMWYFHTIRLLIREVHQPS